MPDITVIYKKLGRNKAMGRALQTDFIIEIDNRLKGMDQLDTTIHETIHCLIPEFVEEKVDNLATEIAKVLWKEGWRKVEL